MVTFSIPSKDGEDKGFFSFNVETNAVLFAGSRNRFLSFQVCFDLINAFGKLGFSFITGCASGVDASFRSALLMSEHRKKSIVACAFKERAEKYKGLLPLFVVPDNLPPKVALAKWTLWMTSRCSLLVLFPSEPIGKGSALAFKSAILNNKPVFIVTDTRPAESSLYTVIPSNLFGVVDGFWCVPTVYQQTKMCYEKT